MHVQRRTRRSLRCVEPVEELRDAVRRPWLGGRFPRARAWSAARVPVALLNTPNPSSWLLNRMDSAADCEQTWGMRRRIPLLVAVPLMAAGTFAARALSFVCVPQGSRESGNETAERLHAGAQGVLWAPLIGIVTALLVVSLVAHCVSLVVQRTGRTLSASAFFWLPPLAFLGQEITERFLHTEAGLSGAALLHVVVGLLLSLPLGVVALLVGLATLSIASHVVRRLRAGLPRRRSPISLPIPRYRAARPSLTLLALGHPQRGPPSLT
jgi:hypothetical protein